MGLLFWSGKEFPKGLLPVLITSKVREFLFGSRDYFWVPSMLPLLLMVVKVLPRDWFEAMAAAKVHESHMWFFGGDFNETPNDSVVAETVQALNGSLSTLGAPTRFEGKQGNSTGFVSNHPQKVSQVTSPVLALSDHRILVTSLQVPVPRPQRGVLPKSFGVSLSRGPFCGFLEE